MKRYVSLKVIVLLSVCLGVLILAACVADSNRKKDHGQSEDSLCGVYTVATSDYSVPLEQGVTLLFGSSGQPSDIPVYCQAKEALYALYALEENAPASKGDWMVYELDANWQLDVVEVGSHDFRLGKNATIKKAVEF